MAVARAGAARTCSSVPRQHGGRGARGEGAAQGAEEVGLCHDPWRPWGAHRRSRSAMGPLCGAPTNSGTPLLLRCTWAADVYNFDCQCVGTGQECLILRARHLPRHPAGGNPCKLTEITPVPKATAKGNDKIRVVGLHVCVTGLVTRACCVLCVHVRGTGVCAVRPCAACVSVCAAAARARARTAVAVFVAVFCKCRPVRSSRASESRPCRKTRTLCCRSHVQIPDIVLIAHAESRAWCSSA